MLLRLHTHPIVQASKLLQRFATSLLGELRPTVPRGFKRSESREVLKLIIFRDIKDEWIKN